MCEFCAFAQILICAFFEYISECINILLWDFFVFFYSLFCIINYRISVATFLLVSFLHFASCGHMHIVQYFARACAYFFAFLIYMPISLLALFFPTLSCFAYLCFFWKIGLTWYVLFLQDFVDGMCYCKALVCCHNLLLAVVWT